MRRDMGRLWPVASLFVAFVSQHLMLCGLVLPLVPVLFSGSRRGDEGFEELTALDYGGAAICLLGIATAFFADNQLFVYTSEGTTTKKRDDGSVAGRPLVLDTGLWGLSRHPNHLGEQTFWVGLAVIGYAAAVSSSPPHSSSSSSLSSSSSSSSSPSPPEHYSAPFDLRWCCLGLLFNHLCDNLATIPLIEERMAAKPERAAAFKAYCRATPVLLPSPAAVWGALISSPLGSGARTFLAMYSDGLSERCTRREHVAKAGGRL